MTHFLLPCIVFPISSVGGGGGGGGGGSGGGGQILWKNENQGGEHLVIP